jgi:hypothetical protein
MSELRSRRQKTIPVEDSTTSVEEVTSDVVGRSVDSNEEASDVVIPPLPHPLLDDPLKMLADYDKSMAGDRVLTSEEMSCTPAFPRVFEYPVYYAGAYVPPPTTTTTIVVQWHPLSFISVSDLQTMLPVSGIGRKPRRKGSFQPGGYWIYVSWRFGCR